MTAAPYQTMSLFANDPSHIGEARRLALALARQIGFGEVPQSNLAIVVTEATRNALQHARQGHVLLRAIERGEAVGIELMVLDRGPGIADVHRCLRDGFSTGGTPGTGLGAISRLSEGFAIYSLPDQGTALLARIWKSPPVENDARYQVGVICAAKPDETECGDGWAAKLEAGRLRLLISDGLGHGPAAAAASVAARRTFVDSLLPGPQLLEQMHQQLRTTRGAAVMLVELDIPRGQVVCCGVGNIAGTVVGEPKNISLVSLNGTVGRELPRLRTFEYPWNKDALLVVHTDGLLSRWQLAPYPGLMRHDPALTAGVLYRDFQRGRDDVTIVVVRTPTAPAYSGSSPPAYAQRT